MKRDPKSGIAVSWEETLDLGSPSNEKRSKVGNNSLIGRYLPLEDVDGGLHPAVDGQSLDEDEGRYLMSGITI